MFEDDVYDKPDSDGVYYQLRNVTGGWCIVDLDEPNRFKTIFTDRVEAQDFCDALNEGRSSIERESDYDTPYERD